MFSSLQQLAAEPHDLSQAEKRIVEEIWDEEPYYSTKILILSFIWAGLDALHKASTI